MFHNLRLLGSFLLAILFVTSCKTTPKQQVETILFNGVVYTSDSNFSIHSAIAIDSGKIVGIGSDDDILDAFEATDRYNLDKRPVYPGLIDAHSHFYGFGKNMQELDLRETVSLEDMIERTVAYARSTQPAYILGRGWNEENWITKGSISNNKLNLLFPDIPVILTRVDGHALLCNQAALDLAGIDENFEIEGGVAVRMGYMLTGLLVDQAMEPVLSQLPDLSLPQKVKALKDAERKCFEAGLTMVTDAGLDESIILLIDSLQRTGELRMKVYAMANPDTNAVNRLLKNDNIRNNPLLNLRSIKLYGDGSLGSRGALLKHKYCDDSTTHGTQIMPTEFYQGIINYCYRNSLQVNTHCIGDSSNHDLLQLYANRLGGKNDLRWRIEHAQIVDSKDLHLFSENDIIPSIQPTHATSDASMAQHRLCNLPAMKGAYVYKTLLDETGLVAYGTDFPVEDIDPIATYFSAVKRRTKTGEVFKPEEAIGPRESLLAMTRWAAYACFMDQETGSLEIGKAADITILSENMIGAYERGSIHVEMTLSNGDVVYNNQRISKDIPE